VHAANILTTHNDRLSPAPSKFCASGHTVYNNMAASYRRHLYTDRRTDTHTQTNKGSWACKVNCSGFNFIMIHISVNFELLLSRKVNLYCTELSAFEFYHTHACIWIHAWSTVIVINKFKTISFSQFFIVIKRHITIFIHCLLVRLRCRNAQVYCSWRRW